ncbi:uncharacterized protein LOC142625282 [Castanea sativa]|uniref:uncharacterized protein LOC142625282 n=1 Tax=Castanea sativa TaxID=21020 RepID=UPI003F649B40
MSCIKSVSYSVLLNGVPGSNVKSSKGLRQGNSSSPYLFLLCAIGLQGLLHKAEVDGSIRGVSICRNGPRVSHLFFADDSVIFCHAKESECQWGYNGVSKKVHWVKWERLCQAKDCGGMGFKQIEKFNEALLAKQVWCMMKNPKSLCHRVFKARFFPNCSILEATPSANGLYAWKSILSAQDVVRKGMVWQIGDGKTVCLKEDKWLPDQLYRSMSSPLPSIPPDAKVQDDYKMEIFAISAWLLWNRRNSVRLQRPTQPLNQVFFDAVRNLQDFLEAHDKAPATVQDLVQPKCSTSNQTRYKANFDGALFKHTNSAGLGIVIRDNNGAVISALSTRIPLPQSSAMVEVLACRRAIQFAVEIGLHKVIFKGDVALVINALSNGGANQSSYGHIVDDILAQTSLLSFSEFCFATRSCNKVADTSAERAKTDPHLQVWLEECPKDITPLVLDDVP